MFADFMLLLLFMYTIIQKCRIDMIFFIFLKKGISAHQGYIYLK